MLKHRARMAPELLYDKNRGIVLRQYTFTDAKEALVHPADLRARYELTMSSPLLSIDIAYHCWVSGVVALSVLMSSRANRYASPAQYWSTYFPRLRITI